MLPRAVLGNLFSMLNAYSGGVKEGDPMASSMFFLGISMIIICSFSLSVSVLLSLKTKRNVHIYISLLLASYLVELIELLYIARFCLPEDTRNFNLINFPVLRIFTTVSILLLDFLILLEIMNRRFQKWHLLLFAAVILFCGYIAWLPQTLLTVWLFYLPRQLYHFGYCLLFLIRRFLEKDEAVQKKMERYSFLVLGVFLLSVSILLEDSLLISHIQTYFTDMLSVTERNFSENILWLFIMLYSTVYSVRELEEASVPVSASASFDGSVPGFGSGTADAGSVQSPGSAQSSGSAQSPGPAQSFGFAQDPGSAQSLGSERSFGSMQNPGSAQSSGSVQSPGTAQNSGPAQGLGTLQSPGNVQPPGFSQRTGYSGSPGAAEQWWSPALPDDLAEMAEEFKFTPREIQILNCILQYKTTAEICEELNISIGTVKTHTHNIYMKVNVKSRQELIRVLTRRE